MQDMQQINMICHLYFAQNIDTVLCISGQILNSTSSCASFFAPTFNKFSAYV